jgi:hypothetical protein
MMMTPLEDRILVAACGIVGIVFAVYVLTLIIGLASN